MLLKCSECGWQGHSAELVDDFGEEIEDGELFDQATMEGFCPLCLSFLLDEIPHLDEEWQ